MRNGLACVSLVALAAGCSPAPGADPEAMAAEVMAADVAFARETAERGADGWADWFATDGVMFPSTGRVDGRDAIRDAMSGAFGPRSRLDWAPDTAVVSASGDLAYTLGRWRAVSIAESGEESVVGSGNYVSIWKRDEDGAWRVAVDIGNNDRSAEDAGESEPQPQP